MATIRRIKDGKGDQGARSEAIKWNEDGTFKEVIDSKPTIGCSMLVGSVTARSYSKQDYWLTTEVTEILEEIKNDDTFYIRFKTRNSEYEWWTGKYPKEK
jgi:hypothetical protein